MGGKPERVWDREEGEDCRWSKLGELNPGSSDKGTGQVTKDGKG